jgi:ribonuclease HI
VADKKKNLIVNFDGLCEPINPSGIACYGFIVKDEWGNTLHRDYGLIIEVEPFSSAVNNNVAEYGAAIKAMEWLAENGYGNSDNKNDEDRHIEITMRGDSQLIIRKLKSAGYSKRAAKLTSMYNNAIAMRSKFADFNIRFEWVKRDYNREADALAKRGYYETLRRYPILQRKVRKHWAARLWLEEKMHCDSDSNEKNN